jgi:hypothetical protein
MTTKTTKLPPAPLVQIAESKRANELHRLTQRYEAAQSSYRLTSDRTRGSAAGGADLERVLGPQRQALEEIGRTIDGLKALSGRELVLRYLPEVPEDSWGGSRTRPAF